MTPAHQPPSPAPAQARRTTQAVDGTVPFLLDGMAAAEPVAVAAPPDRLAVIRAGLGAAAPALARRTPQAEPRPRPARDRGPEPRPTKPR